MGDVGSEVPPKPNLSFEYTPANSRSDTRGRSSRESVVIGRIEDHKAVQVRFVERADPDRVDLTEVETFDPWKGRRLATVALWYVLFLNPHAHLVSSPEVHDSDAGRGWLAKIRGEGLPVHRSQCYKSGGGCSCCLNEPGDA